MLMVWVRSTYGG